MDQPPLPFAREHRCEATLKRGAPCGNRAYFRSAGLGLVCGVHARADEGAEPLAPNPHKKRIAREKRARDRAAVEDAARANSRAGLRGALTVSKLRMMRAPEDQSGFMKVFPNNRHGGRADGFGCPSLSPMRLGPVAHGQPGLPPARNLENFHQGNKVFRGETDPGGAPSAGWAVTQLAMYASDEPQRHKAAAGTVAGDGRRRNAPLYSVWRGPDGGPRRFSYIESRQFYCGFYERLATAPGSEAAADLEALRACLDAGYNLQIVGYDARPVGDIQAMYLDPSAPFGHELVLYALLALDPADYPWRRHRTEDF
jgi:hypothetical protein